MIIRIIDIGSNSVKASLYNIDGGEHRLIAKDKLDYALGDSVFSEGSIPDSATDKVADFIKSACNGKADGKPHFTFIAATESVRSAKNSEAVVKRLNQKTGFEVRVLTGAEESFLIHTGITCALPAGDEDVIKTIDIGGGSAEVSWSRGRKFLFGHSYELGAIRLAQKFFKTTPFVQEEFDRVYEFALEQLRKHTPVAAPAAVRAIGSSGNIRAIAKMVQTVRSPAFSKAIPEVTPGAIEDVLEISLGKSAQQLAALFDIQLKRARIILPGALALLASMRHFTIHRLEVSEAGLREGIAYFWSRHGHLNLPVAKEEVRDSEEKKNQR